MFPQRRNHRNQHHKRRRRQFQRPLSNHRTLSIAPLRIFSTAYSAAIPRSIRRARRNQRSTCICSLKIPVPLDRKQRIRRPARKPRQLPHNRPHNSTPQTHSKPSPCCQSAAWKTAVEEPPQLTASATTKPVLRSNPVSSDSITSPALNHLKRKMRIPQRKHTQNTRHPKHRKCPPGRP